MQHVLLECTYILQNRSACSVAPHQRNDPRLYHGHHFRQRLEAYTMTTIKSLLANTLLLSLSAAAYAATEPCYTLNEGATCRIAVKSTLGGLLTSYTEAKCVAVASYGSGEVSCSMHPPTICGFMFILEISRLLALLLKADKELTSFCRTHKLTTILFLLTGNFPLCVSGR